MDGMLALAIIGAIAVLLGAWWIAVSLWVWWYRGRRR